jgi:hypothetical protein
MKAPSLDGALPKVAVAASLPSLSGGKFELPKIPGMDFGKLEASLGDLKAKLPAADFDKLSAQFKGIGTPDFKMPDMGSLKASLPGVDLSGFETSIKDLKLPSLEVKVSLLRDDSVIHKTRLTELFHKQGLDAAIGDAKAALPSLDAKVCSYWMLREAHTNDHADLPF